MSSERTRRNARPSAKQKEIGMDGLVSIWPDTTADLYTDAGKRALVKAKQPKPLRNAPEQVQKRREAGSGSVCSSFL